MTRKTKRRTRYFELTSADTGKTVVWSLAKCNRVFGKAEFSEIRAGYLPNMLALEVKEPKR